MSCRESANIEKTEEQHTYLSGGQPLHNRRLEQGGNLRKIEKEN
ncbi:hypothetical protein HMPREF3034_01040 [Prevotella sp. DNF00663]|nr:hypothetical protein HMPREF3034_01040 [Prevotella sp. DNF00663]